MPNKITASELKVGNRIIADGKQVFANEDKTGTIIRVFDTTVKVQLDNGSKWYISKEYVKPFTDNM